MARPVVVRYLSEADALRLCSHPEFDLREGSVSAAYKQGELCVGAFDGHAAVGYCWLAFSPLPHLDPVWVRFDRSIAWLHKSFVLPGHRGRGIAPALYRFGDVACLERGCRRSVICVESHNAASVAAALRGGYAPSGYAAYALHGERLRAFVSPAAKATGTAFFLPAEA